ncbi:hypothetical protein GCM10023320_55190 [Pseudonocardia adelaidensis]|uniref:HEPN domain-containing protein n=1 Tax=Pseudonocardia adelaidensis TaxID=648754 RepID=A0ABP9NRQ3_9PSEU
MLLNGTFDRALEVAAELEDCLLLAQDQADATLFRVRVLARDLEGAFMDALTIRAPLVGDYDGALGSARELVTVLRRIYPLAFELDDARYAGVKSNVDHAFACAQVFVTVLEMAEERGPGEPDLAVVPPDGAGDAGEVEEQVREQWARILPFEGERD